MTLFKRLVSWVATSDWASSPAQPICFWPAAHDAQHCVVSSSVVSCLCRKKVKFCSRRSFVDSVMWIEMDNCRICSSNIVLLTRSPPKPGSGQILLKFLHAPPCRQAHTQNSSKRSVIPLTRDGSPSPDQSHDVLTCVDRETHHDPTKLQRINVTGTSVFHSSLFRMCTPRSACTCTCVWWQQVS